MENKTGKYFKYAIGEILLVVIGIMIALQINNWNENRKLAVKSYNYLQRLQEDIESVSKGVNSSIKASERKYHQALLALNALEAKELLPSQQEAFDKHLKEYFQFEITIQNTTAFNEMVSSGDLGLIKNKWLRTAFADMSDERNFIIEVNQSNHDGYKNNMELIRKHIRYNIQNVDTDSSRAKVNYDFNAMANDELFINQISNQVYTWHDVLRIYKHYERRVNNVKDSIQIELKKYD
ncbi:MAG: hypothetical protein KC469_07165 [Flavobacteriaceae bacterium]|jgi:hypothetical protein|nr:hypothetical protein [Flavobacteriaceae bacterium]